MYKLCTILLLVAIMNMEAAENKPGAKEVQAQTFVILQVEKPLTIIQQTNELNLGSIKPGETKILDGSEYSILFTISGQPDRDISLNAKLNSQGNMAEILETQWQYWDGFNWQKAETKENSSNIDSYEGLRIQLDMEGNAQIRFCPLKVKASEFADDNSKIVFEINLTCCVMDW